MNGQDISKRLISRKHFLYQLGALALIPAACNRNSRFAGSIVGANAGSGHRLRTKIGASPVQSFSKPIVIVGGGVAGLTAAYRLKQNGIDDFVLLELSDDVGGNAACGQNAVGKYPWGAHYLPVPDHRDRRLIDFLEEVGVITGYDETGLPFYHEEYLCFDPEERLYINGYWQEGLVPDFGVPSAEKEQIRKFFLEIEKWRLAKGTDGKDAFCIPVHMSSEDESFRKLDLLTFEAYLRQNGYNSPYLLWYLNYCTMDDYGGKIQSVSAWAGIHYFAARKGKAANTLGDTVLTWPEGNAWLVNKLREKVKEHIITGALVFKVDHDKEQGVAKVHYMSGEVCIEVVAQQVIMSAPQYIAHRIIPGYQPHKYNYAPWMVANLTVDTFYENVKGVQMSWDNVIYGSRSLGYVNASHQHITQFDSKRILTYYYPLCDRNPAEEREQAMNKTHGEWVKLIIDELRIVHPGIESFIRNVDVWIWGHGMVLPEPGLQHLRTSRPLVPCLDGNIWFAHSDLSGISIFEEAFHQGYNAADAIINKTNENRSLPL